MKMRHIIVDMWRVDKIRWFYRGFISDNVFPTKSYLSNDNGPTDHADKKSLPYGTMDSIEAEKIASVLAVGLIPTASPTPPPTSQQYPTALPTNQTSTMSAPLMSPTAAPTKKVITSSPQPTLFSGLEM